MVSGPSDALFWQAKVLGLLYDPAQKPLHGNAGRNIHAVNAAFTSFLQKNVDLADCITSASDRATIGSLPQSVNYGAEGLEIFHLLSGAKLPLVLPPDIHANCLQSGCTKFLSSLEPSLIPENICKEKDIRKVFWWLWRCLPVAVCQALGEDEQLLLMPFETRLPDSSLWSHTSLTAAMAGALAGYNRTSVEIQSQPRSQSHPYLASFTFSPIQELIKASRKMRDFWAGSWILHYLSARVCWKLAQIYGPDSLVYPSLFQQPLIDHWLLQQWHEDFKDWVKPPSNPALLTAGFPNVLVLVLPEEQVRSAMQTAEQTLKQEWLKIADLVFKSLQEPKSWMPGLEKEHGTWNGWLKAVWQTYWTALPIGKTGEELEKAIVKGDEAQQNWWADIFNQTRLTLTSVKSAQNWTLPIAYSTRSTVSGVGAAVHPERNRNKSETQRSARSCSSGFPEPAKKWMTESEIKSLWQPRLGLFNGSEQLNATETVKRVFPKILPQLLNSNENKISVSYPDLTAGVAGYLKVSDRAHLHHFLNVCQDLVTKLEQLKLRETLKGIHEEQWGIPWIDNQNSTFNKYHSRLLNAGLLIEDVEKQDDLKKDYQAKIQQILDRYYPVGNPSDWYVIAAGNGDSMSKWLKGSFLKKYADYVPRELKDWAKTPPKSDNSKERELQKNLQEKFQKFLELKKRMGPSTHNALSRALLDFSNQLAPYLTEQRYAGRLIYGAGDDILAYTNLWEWDKWLWDIRQCFRGAEDPQEQFNNRGDYWHWQKGKETIPPNLSMRPLFTMGGAATISFGIIIAHHSVPLAIALENLWEAEDEAKKHYCRHEPQKKDAVQVRAIYSDGNILQATAKFEVFNQWRSLLEFKLDAALFEQAAQLWEQHPVPHQEAIPAWTQIFCRRRNVFHNQLALSEEFQQCLAQLLNSLWTQADQAKDDHKTAKQREREIQNWLQLAAFILRHRDIKLGGENH